MEIKIKYLPQKKIRPYLLGTLLSALLLTTACVKENPAWPELLQRIRSTYPDVPQMSTEDLDTQMKKNPNKVLLLDIREKAEYDISRIPGAKWLAPKDDPATLLKNLDNTITVVAYCSVGYRSSEMVTRIQKLGIKKVYNLEGSIFKWTNEGRPLSDGSAGQGGKVHPYNEKWSELVLPKYRGELR